MIASSTFFSLFHSFARVKVYFDYYQSIYHISKLKGAIKIFLSPLEKFTRYVGTVLMTKLRKYKSIMHVIFRIISNFFRINYINAKRGKEREPKTVKQENDVNCVITTEKPVFPAFTVAYTIGKILPFILGTISIVINLELDPKCSFFRRGKNNKKVLNKKV